MPLDRSAFTGSRVLQPVWKLKPRYVEPMFNPRHSHGTNFKKPLLLNSLVSLFVVFLSFWNLFLFGSNAVFLTLKYLNCYLFLNYLIMFLICYIHRLYTNTVYSKWENVKRKWSIIKDLQKKLTTQNKTISV